MMSPSFLTFDYDFASEQWNLPRGTVPTQLKSQGVPHALWMHFWDYAQSVVERASVRAIMKRKLITEIEAKDQKDGHRSHQHHGHTHHKLSKQQRQERQTEIARLDEQTKRDFGCLERQAERLFPNTRASVNKDARYSTMERFGLELQLLHSQSGNIGGKDSKDDNTLYLNYDDKKASWDLPRDILPEQLEKHGVQLADWIVIWDYGFGVNQRAKEREHLNELHGRELRLCEKSLSYMNSTNVPSVDQNATSAHNTTANHIRAKMEKLLRAKEANTNNTKKGWQELQRRASQRFEPYDIKAYLSRPENEQICCQLIFQCPKTTKLHQQQKKIPPTSSIWLPSTPSRSVSSRSDSPTISPIPSVWNFAKEHFRTTTSQDQGTLSSSSTAAASASVPSSDANVLRPKRPNEKENAPPRPETLLRKTKSVWGHPVVLTYVHDEIPSRIEVTTPLSTDADDYEYTSSFEEDSNGYVVPPAPSDPPSSIGSSSSSSLSGIASFQKEGFPTSPVDLLLSRISKKKYRRVHFGPNEVKEYENPYSKNDRKALWFTHEEREACRSRTKVLAQRVIDNRCSGAGHNVVFMDSETEEEVCWRGLEHAKKGNLSSRQETRRAFLVKVLEKQRQLRLRSMTNRRGASIADPAHELQDFAYRHSRECRERAQKLAAHDAKEARAVYKESLRKTNLMHVTQSTICATPSGMSFASSKCSAEHSQSQYYDENSLDIFQDYCRQMHLASKSRVQQAVV